jgi:hypothetical protein
MFWVIVFVGHLRHFWHLADVALATPVCPL